MQRAGHRARNPASKVFSSPLLPPRSTSYTGFPRRPRLRPHRSLLIASARRAKNGGLIFLMKLRRGTLNERRRLLLSTHGSSKYNFRRPDVKRAVRRVRPGGKSEI